MKHYTLPEDHVLALKILNADRTSNHNNFQYPELGKIVTDLQWEPNSACGGGLHGYLWGLGDICISLYNPARSMVFQVHEVKEYVDLGDKIKYPTARVVAEFSSIIDALEFIQEYKPETLPRLNSVVVLQNNIFSSVQDSKSEDIPAVQQGASEVIQTSDSYLSHQIANNRSTQITKGHSKQVAGMSSIQVGGVYSVQFARDFSFQKAGDYSKCEIGINSVQKLGYKSIFKAGIDSCVILQVLNIQKGIYEDKIFYVDGKKIKSNTWYTFDENRNKLRKVDQDGNFLPSKLDSLWNTVLERLANLPSTLGF